MSTDYLFFKFRPINKFLIESLVSPSVYFSNPSNLNDPFDCQLDIRKSFSRAVEKAQGNRKKALHSILNTDGALNRFSEHFKSIGVCSFSRLENSFDEPLLWSHYADGHKGVCLLYRFTEDFLNNPEEIIGVSEVKYGVDILTDWLANSEILPNQDFVTELIKVILTAKSTAWRNEKEVRIIRPSSGNFTIPHGCLEQICFGLRTPTSDIELVKKLAEEYSGCSRFYKIEHADTDFGISPIGL